MKNPHKPWTPDQWLNCRSAMCYVGYDPYNSIAAFRTLLWREPIPAAQFRQYSADIRRLGYNPYNTRTALRHWLWRTAAKVYGGLA